MSVETTGPDAARALGIEATAVDAIFGGHPEIAVAYLFGSRARGEARSDSDIDIGVVYRSSREPRTTHARVSAAVAAAIGKLTGISRVDVVDLEAQGPIFCHEVLRDGRRLYVADPVRRVDFESETLVRAFDFRPTYELATAGKIAAMRRWLREHHDVGASTVEARHSKGEPRQAR